MKIIITEKQLNTLNNEKNSHRYDKGEESPGIEKFLKNPNDDVISNGLLSELNNDPNGKGKMVITFNGEEFKKPEAFISKIQSDFKAGRCYTLTTYEFKTNKSTNLIDFDKYDPSRWILNTEIKITAIGGVCKKFCKYKISVPLVNRPRGDKKYKDGVPLEPYSEKRIKEFKYWCSTQPDLWNIEYSDGTKSRFTSKEEINNSDWNCFAQSCLENIKKKSR